MIIDANNTNGWRSDCTHIDVYPVSALVNLNGEIDGHKIIEIEPLGNGYIAVKTIGWGRLGNGNIAVKTIGLGRQNK